MRFRFQNPTLLQGDIIPYRDQERCPIWQRVVGRYLDIRQQCEQGMSVREVAAKNAPRSARGSRRDCVNEDVFVPTNAIFILMRVGLESPTKLKISDSLADQIELLEVAANTYTSARGLFFRHPGDYAHYYDPSQEPQIYFDETMRVMRECVMDGAKQLEGHEDMGLAYQRRLTHMAQHIVWEPKPKPEAPVVEAQVMTFPTDPRARKVMHRNCGRFIAPKAE
jgi:hypothetical protein